jgi:DNA polymerase alpha-associated DNA helicase A
MGVPEHEVAVVTPYQAQVSLISEMIREDHPTMTIGSVDGLQGQEREVSPTSIGRILISGNHTESGPIKYIRRSRFPGRV